MGKIRLAKATPFSGAPKINAPAVFGASPDKPIIFRIPVTGERPIKYSVIGLPKGLSLSENIITGKVENEGNYKTTLVAENAQGRAEKEFVLEIAPNNVLVTPLLGFTTWNAFANKVTQEDMINSAHNLVKHGISEYGYSYVNLDSGWQYQYGGELDAIQPNPKFPDMRAMTDEIHSLGLKCGIYSTPMLTAWGCPDEYESIPGCTQGEADIRFNDMMGGIGVIRKERNNAKQWEMWGFDYLKYDWSPTDSVNADLMRCELLALNRDFGLCVSVVANPSYNKYWSHCTSSYRRNKDSLGYWENLVAIYNSYFMHGGMEKWMNKGHYFDLDMLDVGNCVFKNNDNFLTEDEMVVAYSMRAFLNSPIQLSAVLDDVSDFDMSLYCNDEIIAVNQDALFAPSNPIYRRNEEKPEFDVIEKALSDGTFAYAIFNMSDTLARVSIEFAEYCSPRDLWAKEDFAGCMELQAKMPGHTVRIFKCTKKAKKIIEL